MSAGKTLLNSRDQATKGLALNPAATLDRFHSDTHSRACRVARLSVRDRDVALDRVQDAMIRLAQHYSNRPATTLTVEGLCFTRFSRSAGRPCFIASVGL